MTSTTMPSLYIGHGAPPLLDDPLWSGQLAAWARDLPRPSAILVVSAHWESAPLAISAAEAGTPLVYDFGGFHPKYYRETYATPNADALADRVAAMMPDHEPVHRHPSRGLDHGAWVPMKLMYPAGGHRLREARQADADLPQGHAQAPHPLTVRRAVGSSRDVGELSLPMAHVPWGAVSYTHLTLPTN